MNDSEIRGLVLKRLYEVRHEEDFTAVPDDLKIPNQNMKVLGNIAKQLNEQGLIVFKQHMGQNYPSGYGHITASGIDVVEGTRHSPISITIDSSVNVHSSQGVQIGGQGNSQNITMDIGKLVSAVDGGVGTIQEKEEAKSLLKRLADNPLVKGAIELWAKANLGA